MHKGKKYVDSAKTIDRTKQYDPAEALSTVVSTAKAKFDETIELHVKLGVAFAGCFSCRNCCKF